MKRIILILLIVLSSCKTIGIQKQMYNQVELATIGSTKNKFIKEFQTNAIPKLTTKIRLGISLKEFTKSSFKSFQQANKQLGKSSNLNYIDSLEVKPKYINLVIIDKLNLLNNFNNSKNKHTINYLKTSNNLKIVTEIELVFPKNIEKDLLKAEDIFLTQDKNHKYAIEISTNKTTQTIPFSKATIFNYKTNIPCWGINDNHIIILADINNKCSKNTYNSFHKAKKKNELHFIKL